MDKLKIGFHCPHCEKPVQMELDVQIMHVTGQVKKPVDTSPQDVHELNIPK